MRPIPECLMHECSTGGPSERYVRKSQVADGQKLPWMRPTLTRFLRCLDFGPPDLSLSAARDLRLHDGEPAAADPASARYRGHYGSTHGCRWLRRRGVIRRYLHQSRLTKKSR